MARDVLSAAGFLVKITDVVALPVADCPGGLAAILDVLDLNKISVEYMYAFTFGRSTTAVMVFRFEDTDKATKILSEAHINIIEPVELFD